MMRTATILLFGSVLALRADPLNYTVSWLGNSFSGASNKWVQNFFIHTRVQPDGAVNTWSHWDEGSDMRHISRVFICRGYLAGSRKTVAFAPGARQEAEIEKV